MYLALRPGSVTRKNEGRIDGRVELSVDGRAIGEGKRDVDTNISFERPGRRELAKLIVCERDAVAGELGDGPSKASVCVVQNVVNGERGEEAPGRSRNGSDETLGTVCRHNELDKI